MGAREKTAMSWLTNISLGRMERMSPQSGAKVWRDALGLTMPHLAFSIGRAMTTTATTL